MNDLTFDRAGRAILSDDQLQMIEKHFVSATAGGSTNAVCSNTGDCNGTHNIDCNNATQCGGTNRRCDIWDQEGPIGG